MISLVEEVVFRPPEGLEKYRYFRIEYSESKREGCIWLPEDCSAMEIENVLNGVSWRT